MTHAVDQAVSQAAHARRTAQRFLRIALLVVVLSILAVAVRLAIELGAARAYSTLSTGQNTPQKPPQTVLHQGAYLARAGNCAACHTARGGAAFAGGKAIHTPFGAVFTSNITPDVATGIGNWTADAFYRAMHEGISADSRLLVPAFPYANYTHVTRDDSDALYAYFMHSVPPVVQANKPHELPFPFNMQLALAAWRVMFFDKAKPGESLDDTTKLIAARAYPMLASGTNKHKNDLMTDEIARGTYLVQGLAHCSACHASRNALGAATNQQLLSGALMPMQDWYAPSLLSSKEAGVMHWKREDIVALLHTGVSPSASALGPMAEVVALSTQHLTTQDLNAIASYLQSLPEVFDYSTQAKEPAKNRFQDSAQYQRGGEVFTQYCATCHGAQGQGMQLQGTVALPAFAGNRAITMANSTNLVRMIVVGGYAPSTAGNPRPYGMPPFVHQLSDEDIAAVASYIRNSWGNQAEPVSAAAVVQQRKGWLR